MVVDKNGQMIAASGAASDLDTTSLSSLVAGNVVVRFDEEEQYQLDSAGRIDFDRPAAQLTGRYQANGDLLLITWDDGSQLNYRWLVTDGDLMLTDHYGRVSQLRRHFD